MCLLFIKTEHFLHVVLYVSFFHVVHLEAFADPHTESAQFAVMGPGTAPDSQPPADQHLTCFLSGGSDTPVPWAQADLQAESQSCMSACSPT